MTPLRLAAIVLTILDAITGLSPAAAAGSACRKVVQITGNTDKSLRAPTPTQTQSTAKVAPTDLGSTFEHKGRLYFLFGDPLDAFGYTTSTDPWNVAPLVFPFLDENGKAIRLHIPGLTSYQALCVSSGGVSYDDVMYVVFTTTMPDKTTTMRRSVMGRSFDDGLTWENLYDLSTQGPGGVNDMANTHFINVSMSVVDAAQWPGLPYTGDVLLIYGTGKYRQSNPYLAVMPANAIADRTTLRYFAGLDPSAQPTWSTLESEAVPLFSETPPELGEFSCQFIPQLNQWVMLYKAVTMRTADLPWGPFSSPTQLWDPTTWFLGWAENGYGDWLHVPSTFAPFAPADPTVIHYDDFGEGDSWGGPYGPYLVPRWTTGDASNLQLYFTMSSHNPYAVYIMRAQIPAPVDPPIAGQLVIQPGDGSWTQTGGTWFTYPFEHAGQSWFSTSGPSGEADVGVSWRWLPRDAKNRSLYFQITGGDQEVLLLEGTEPGPPVTGSFPQIYTALKAGTYGRVVQAAWGHKDASIDANADWDLRNYDSANLKLVIIDKQGTSAAGWHWVALGPMTLTRFQ